MMNWKDAEGRGTDSFRQCPRICLKGLRKTLKNLSHEHGDFQNKKQEF
jgi:hypothetical protein